MNDTNERPDETNVVESAEKTGGIIGIAGAACGYATELLVCCAPVCFGSVSPIHVAGFFLAMGFCLFAFRKGSSPLRRLLVLDRSGATRGSSFPKVFGYGLGTALCLLAMMLLPSGERWGVACGFAASLFAGFFSGATRLAWIDHLGRRRRGESRAGVPLLVACLFALLVLWLDSSASFVVFVVLPLASSVMLIASIKTMPGAVSAAASGEDASYLDASNHLLLFGYLFVWGFAMGFFAGAWDRAFATIALLCSALFVGVFVFSKGERHTSVGDTAKVFLPLCVVLCFGLLSEWPPVHKVVIAAAFVAMVFQSCSNITFLENMAIKLDIDCVVLVSSGRFPPLIGLGAGFAASAAYAEVYGFVPEQIAPCLFLSFVVGSYAFLPFNRGNPMKGGVVRDVEEGIVPLFLDNSSGTTLQRFERECDRISNERGLSSRENDVFRLLACGYNTTAIAEKLFISTSTVKTHCSHIYEKLGVRSRQEIVAMINNEIIGQ